MSRSATTKLIKNFEKKLVRENVDCYEVHYDKFKYKRTVPINHKRRIKALAHRRQLHPRTAAAVYYNETIAAQELRNKK